MASILLRKRSGRANHPGSGARPRKSRWPPCRRLPFQQVIDVGDVDAQTGDGLRSISMDRYCWPLTRSIRRSCALQRLGHLADLAGHLLQLVEVVTEDLDGDIGTDAGHHFVDAVGNRLRHRRSARRAAPSVFAHGVLDVVLRPALGPFAARLEADDGVDSFGPCGSAGDSPRPTPDTADLTPGTCMTRRMASISILIDSSSEMLGTRLMPGTTEPSFISG